MERGECTMNGVYDEQNKLVTKVTEEKAYLKLYFSSTDSS